MKILIANLSPEESHISNRSLESRITTLHFPMGLGIVAAVLKGAGFQFLVYDSYVNGTRDGFLQTIEAEKPDIVLLSGFLGNYTYAFVKDVARQIKSINPYTMIIIGGPMASTIPDLLISKTMVDYAIKGEGECTIIELLDAIGKKIDPSRVKGVYFKDSSGNVVFAGEHERIKNLDEYPFPFYDAFPIEPYVSYLKETGRCWEISTSRGCYASCSFCKLTFGKKITSFSNERVIEHMVSVSEKYGINRFNLVDDNFLNNPKKVDDFCASLKKHPYQFKWRFQGRADRISPETVEKMAEVGLFDISFGIESGSQEMLNRYGKKLDIKKALTNLQAIKGMVRIHATFIVGGPAENWKTIKETELFIKKLKLNNAGIGILTLFPGTVFYNEAYKEGLIRDDDEYCMNLGPVYDKPYTNISDMTDYELLKARDMLVETASEFGVYQ